MKPLLCILLVLAVGVAACGPTGLVLGVADLGSDGSDNFFVVFANDNAEPVILRINGQSFALSNIQIPPGGSTQIAVPDSETSLRVRGYDVPSSTRPPTAWDYMVTTNGTNATSVLAKETMVFSSLFGKTSSGGNQDVIDIEHLDTNKVAYRKVNSTPLGFSPELVCLHPSGAYCYTVDDVGNGNGEIRAYRVDATTGGLSLIEGEFGSTPNNPIGFTFKDSFSCAVDRKGRFFYLLDNDDSIKRTKVTSYVVTNDGSLRVGGTSTRGRIRDMKIGARGENAYIAESLGNGHKIRALRINPQTGVFDLQVNEADTPCTPDDSNPPRIFIHPNGRFVYVATPNSTPKVKFGSYFLFSDGSIFKNPQCLGFDVLYDLTFDLRGDVVFVTGKNDQGKEGLLRYGVNADTGELTLIGTQTFSSSLSNANSQSDPSLPSSDPLKFLTFLAKGDSLVPHTRGAGAVLQPVKDSQGNTLSLPYGSSTSVRTTVSALRGKANTITSN